MTKVRWRQSPVVAQHELAHQWILKRACLHLAPSTVDAYRRCINDYLSLCAQLHIQPECLTGEQTTLYLQDIALRANPKGANVVSISSR